MLAATDPNLFHLDWDRTVEVLAAIVLLSMVVERALAPAFESRWFIRTFSEKDRHPKEIVAFVVSLVVCIVWDFDAVSMMILAERTNWFGATITAGVIAGGSKGSVQLFREWLKFKSTARQEYEAKREAAKPEAKPNATDAKPDAKGGGKKG